MKPMSMEAGQFTPERPAGLRRSIGHPSATCRHGGRDYGLKFVEGLVRRGYDPEFARRWLQADRGLPGSYDFPESHRGELRAS